MVKQLCTSVQITVCYEMKIILPTYCATLYGEFITIRMIILFYNFCLLVIPNFHMIGLFDCLRRNSESLSEWVCWSNWTVHTYLKSKLCSCNGKWEGWCCCQNLQLTSLLYRTKCTLKYLTSLSSTILSL